MAKKTKKPVKAPKVPLTPEQQKQAANDKALKNLYGPEGNSAGNALINKFLQPGALGRVGTDLAGSTQDLGRYKALNDKYATRDTAQTDVMGRMQAGLGGYTSPEYQAQREQMQRGLNSNTATAASQLAKAQARGKVYGAAATAQNVNLQTGALNSKNNLEQDLMVKNIDEQQKRLTDYGQYGRGLNQEEYDRQASNTKLYGDEESKLRQEELDRQKINLGQSNAELASQIGAYTGAGATSIAKAQARAAQKIQREGIRKLG